MGNPQSVQKAFDPSKANENLLIRNVFLSKSISDLDPAYFFEGCAFPENIKSINITINSAKVNWSLVGTAENYLVRYRKIGEPSWQAVSSSSNEVSLSGLNASANYEVQVASRCDGKIGEFSNSEKFRTLDTVCEAPGNIRMSEVGSNYAHINWNALPGRNGYSVSYKQINQLDSEWKEIKIWYGGLGSTLGQLSDLKSNTEYVIKVASICDYHKGEFSNSINFKTQPAPACETVKGIGTSNITMDAARVNWTSVGTVGSYALRYRKVGASNWQPQYAYTNSRNLYGLSANTDYEVQIASICSGSIGEYSASINFKTQSTPACEAATGISTSNITMDAARVNWTSVGTVGSYALRYRKVGASNWQPQYAYTNSRNLYGLSANTDYEVQIASICSGNIGEYSASVNFKTQAAGVCEAPTELNIVNITTNAVRLTFSSISTVQYVAVGYRKVGTSNWQEETSYSTTGKYLSNLTPNIDYEVQVASVCNGIRGAFSASVNFKTNSPAAACAVPSRLRVNTVAMNTALIAWDNVNGVTSYTVRYRTVVAGFISNWSSVTAYTNTANLSGLSADKNYEVQVSTICGSSFTDYSASVSFKTLQGGGTGACDAPNGIQASNITTNTAGISWAAVSAATGGYVIFYKPTTQSTWKEILSSTNSVALPILASGINYQVKVASVCNSLGKFSEPITFKTFKTLDNSVTSNVQNAVASSTEAIKLYPNPVVDVLNVSNISGNATYKIYNASGTLLSSGNINDKKINVSQLAQGNYIIMIEQGKDIFRSQFIKR
ncbi:fibronectin type III domain-containing protein [Chryseobacterium sp. ERMR1:04]|uniref:fibronectin type III domain-containing protein n=1 Tax=Chryseobacterium sp. ERMR1:04 TaxID=1705393 RepID=UPI0006C89341|nr:fibronectin type III domain-containing protein [Chryseobacterium sp. ERMR1:04]KPH12237.1 hypothetical protein AMQ68_14915 [Chryseobacterium sp. ERMR1:04]